MPFALAACPASFGASCTISLLSWPNDEVGHEIMLAASTNRGLVVCVCVRERERERERERGYEREARNEREAREARCERGE